MALVAVAADKGAPGVTTASLALAAVWPRPVLLAECDAAGGDLFYRLPAADGGRLDPQRGLLSLAVAARRGIQPHQVWRHTQKLHGGLDILTGLVNAEQAGALESLWGEVGKLLAEVPEVDVIADCGRLGADGPFYDLLAHASAVVLVARATLEDVVRLRDRVIAVSQGLANRRLPGAPIGVVIVADRKHFKRHIAEAGQALALNGAPARIAGGLADEPKTAGMLWGRWSTKLDRSLLIRTARELAGHIARDLPAPLGAVAGQSQHPPSWWRPERLAVQAPGAPPQPGPGPAEQAPAGQVAAGQEGAGQVADGPAAAATGAPGNAPGERVAARSEPTAMPDVAVPATPVPAAPVPAAPVPAAPVPAAPVRMEPEPAGMPVLGVPVVTGPAMAMPLAAAPVPADTVPLGVPVLGASAVTGPTTPPIAAAPAPADAAPGPVRPGRAVPLPSAQAPVAHTPAGGARVGQAPAGGARVGQAPAAGRPAGQATGLGLGDVPSPQAVSEHAPGLAEPLIPLPPPNVPYRAEHAAPLRLVRGHDAAPAGPVPAVRMPAGLDLDAGARHGGPSHGPGAGPGAGQGINHDAGPGMSNDVGPGGGDPGHNSHNDHNSHDLRQSANGQNATFRAGE
jgi:hypothetical protein